MSKLLRTDEDNSSSDSDPSLSEDEDESNNHVLKFSKKEIHEALEFLQISADTISKESKAIGAGSFGDVTKADCLHPKHGPLKVAIKCLRIPMKKDVEKVFEKEVYVWSTLEPHPNILPLIGFFLNKYGYPSLVSVWMDNGSARRYVKKCRDLDLTRFVIGAADGLKFLHKMDCIHSDIKPENIIVDSKGDACICDFGGSRIIDSTQSLVRPTSTLKGTRIYYAYELVVPEIKSGHTKKTDVWAFGMTVYALLTRRPPYTDDFHAFGSLSKHKLPSYPSSASCGPESDKILEVKEKLWKVCQLCWEFNPDNRADMALVLSRLKSDKEHEFEKLNSMDVSRTSATI